PNSFRKDQIMTISGAKMAAMEQRTRGTDGWMTGKRKFGFRRENANLARVRLVRCRQDKGGFGEIELTRNGLHAFGTDACGFREYRELIAAEGGSAENVDDVVSILHVALPRLRESSAS